MGVLVDVRDGKVWLRINHLKTRKSKCVGPDSKATRAEAEKAAAIIRGKLASDDLSPLDTRPVEGPKADPILKNLASEWVAWHQEHFPRRPTTVRNYESFVDSRLIPALGDRRVSTITRGVVQEFVAALRRDGIAYLTLRAHFLPTFRKILDFAVEKGYLAVNPLRAGGPLFEPSDADREAAPRPDPFSPKEVALIIEAAEKIEPEFGLMIATWAACGARSGEIRGLQVKDLDVKAGTVRIERTLQERGGKLVTGPPKNTRGRRTVTLDTSALAHHVRGKAADDYIFEKPDGGPVSFSSLRVRWVRALDLAGVRYREPEQLRHSYISAEMSRGVNVLKIARQTGHSVQVLLTSYAAWIPEVEDASQRSARASRSRKAS